MKKIEAFVRPVKLHDVTKALQEGASDIMVVVSEVRGKSDRTRIKFELVVDDEQVREICALIKKAATTGKGDDGEIAVSSIEGFVRIG